MSPVISRVSSSQAFSSVGGYKRAYIARSGAVGIASSVPTSVRFNSSDSSYLSRTPASAGNRRTWTWAGWVKRSSFGGYQAIFTADAGSGYGNGIWWDNGNGIYFYFGGDVISSAVFRDPSAWYHIVCALDTTQGTDSNRLKLWVNNQQVTQWSSSFWPSYNTDYAINNNVQHTIGRKFTGENQGNFYLADVHFIDGQALTPSSFGQVDGNGVWQPIAYSGTYGSNGFKLNFSDVSNNTATTLGKDASGNSNNWTPNNITTNDGSNTIVYSTRGTISRSGYVVNGPTELYSNPGLVNGGSVSGFAPWGAIAGTQTQDNIGLSFSSTAKVYYNTNVGGGWIALNGSQKSATVPSGGNTTIGLLQWTTGEIGSTLQNIQFASPNDGVGTYVYGIELDGVLLIDYPIRAKLADNFVDTPTSYGTDTGLGAEVRGNYCTLNPLDNPNGITLTNGNLDAVWTTTSHKSIRATHMMRTGKWYYEMRLGSVSATVSGMVGLARPSDSISSHLGTTTNTGIGFANLAVYYDGSQISHGVSFSTGGILGVAFDADAGKVWFSYNGTWINSGNPASGTNAVISSLTDGTWIPAMHCYNNSGSPHSMNFGQRLFAYQAPSGFKTLCTANLTSTTITTSGSFTGNANADGPVIDINGVPTAMTINGNAVTFGTHADKLANGFKIRSSSSSYNTSGSNSYTITTTGDSFKNARAQPNP